MNMISEERPAGTYLARRLHNINVWATFFRQCWRRALDNSKFAQEARRTFERAPLNAVDLFEAWSQQIKVQRAVSARMLGYLDILQRFKIIRESTIIDVVTNHLSAIFDKASDTKARVSEIAELEALVRMTGNTLYRMQSKPGKRSAPDVQLSMRLFKLVGLYAGTAVARGGIITGVALALGEAIANFLIAHVNDLHAAGTLTANAGKPPELLKGAFSKVVPAFIDVLSASGSQLATSLSLLQQQSKLQEGMDDPAEEIVVPNVESVAMVHGPSLDAAVTPSRASLYAYLTAALTATPNLDDVALQVFLTSRYHDDVQIMATDLITTSFDVLAGAIERKEHLEVQIVHKSFITNRIPSILEQLSHHPSFEAGSTSIGQCVTNAVKKVHEMYQGTPVFQPRSDACTKQRFLLASALYGFIQLSAVPTLLGYPPTQGLPSSGRYEKAKLVQECQADPKRIEQLVNELILMEGNAPVIARALLEILHTLCASRDAETLKLLCVAFLRKPHHINIMLLFTSVRVLLQPLCHLLDNWQAQDDQGEQVHVYDEFGSVLLFVLMCQHRYELPLSAFHAPGPGSFILEYFQNSTLATPVKDIKEAMRKQISGWIKGMFETNAIEDELLSTCTPKELYHLSATLTDQIMTAVQTGVLGIDTANSGAEFLLEPFLVPTLVIVFTMFANRLTSMPADASQIDFLMPVLRRLVKPPTIRDEAAPLHQAVLSITAKPLYQALVHIRSAQKNRKDIGPMLDAVKNLQKPFALSAARSLVDDWCTTHDKDKAGKMGSVAATFQSSFDNLNKWNNLARAVPDRHAYNHRLTVFAVNTIGATKALELLLDQASKASTNPKATDQALDTLTGLIAASSLTTNDAKLTLRAALRHANHEAQTRPATKESSARTNFIMRVHRRVEIHCAKPLQQAPPIIPLTVDIAMPDAIGAAAALDPAIAAAASEIEIKDLPMQHSQDLMAGLAEAAKGGSGDVAASQQPSLQGLQGGNDMMNMGEMGDIQDMDHFQDFLNDLDASGSQNFDDIFNSM